MRLSALKWTGQQMRERFTDLVSLSRIYLVKTVSRAEAISA